MPAPLPYWFWFAPGRSTPTSDTNAVTILDPTGSQFVFTPRVGSPTEVFVDGLVDFADSSGHAVADVLETVGGASTVRLAVHYKPDTAEAPISLRPVPRMYVIPAQTTPAQVTLAYRLLSSTGSATVAVTSARFLAAPLNVNDLWASNDGTDTTGATAYQTKLSLTLTAGQWLITWSAQVGSNTGTAAGASVKGTLAGGDVAEMSPVREYVAGNLVYLPWRTTRVFTATGGEKATIAWKAAASTTVGCRHAFITARKVADLPGFFSAETLAEGTGNATSAFVDKNTLTATTTAGDHILIETGVVRATSTSATPAVVTVKRDLDAVDLGVADLYGWSNVPSAPQPWIHGHVSPVTLTAASHTIRTRFSSANSAVTGFVASAGLYLIAVAPSGVQSYANLATIVHTVVQTHTGRLVTTLPASRPDGALFAASGLPPTTWFDADGEAVDWQDDDGLPASWDAHEALSFAAMAAFGGFGAEGQRPTSFAASVLLLDDTGSQLLLDDTGSRLLLDENVVRTGDADDLSPFAVWTDATGEVAVWTDAASEIAGWTGVPPEPPPPAQRIRYDAAAAEGAGLALIAPPVNELRTNLLGWVAEALKGTGARPVRFFYADFGSRGVFACWTGFGERTWSGQLYYGAGEFLTVGNPRESTDRDRNGLTVTLTGADQLRLRDHVRDALLADFHGRKAYIYEGWLDASGNLVDDLVAGYAGEISKMTIGYDDKGAATIQVQLEHEASDLDRGQRYRMEGASQQAIDPDDLGFQYQKELGSRKVDWDGLFYKEVHGP